MSDYHRKVMNLPLPSRVYDRDSHYKSGARDARHAAAEIAAEADAEIARLTARIDKMMMPPRADIILEDWRYPWLHAQFEDGQSPRFAIQVGSKSFGYTLRPDGISPICLCSAHSKSECICETGFHLASEDHDNV